MWFVYFLRHRQKRWYYVGSTNNLIRRLGEHNAGKVKSTKEYRPLTLVRELSFDTEREARLFEHKVKKQRLLKEQIIRTIEKHWGIV